MARRITHIEDEDMGGTFCGLETDRPLNIVELTHIDIRLGFTDGFCKRCLKASNSGGDRPI